MPISPQAVQSMAMPRVSGRQLPHAAGDLAEQIVGRAVVALAVVAEAPGHRAEGDRRADGHALGRLDQAEEAVGLDVEDQVELVRFLVGQRAVDEQSAGVEQHVDACRSGLPDLVDHRGHRVAVHQVDAASSGPCRRPLHRFDGPQRRFAALDGHDLLVDDDRRRPFAPALASSISLRLSASTSLRKSRMLASSRCRGIAPDPAGRRCPCWQRPDR